MIFYIIVEIFFTLPFCLLNYFNFIVEKIWVFHPFYKPFYQTIEQQIPANEHGLTFFTILQTIGSTARECVVVSF
jgi:hypothetical protein